MEQQPLSADELRKIIQTRLLEFQAYQQMDEALQAVIEAEATVSEQRATQDELQRAIDAKQQEFAALEQTVAAKEERLSQRLYARQATAKAELQAIADEVAKKAETLRNWQAHLDAVEQEHKDTLANWQARIEQARAEHREAIGRIELAKGQLSALAALVKA